jgi:hypothetical protein
MLGYALIAFHTSVRYREEGNKFFSDNFLKFAVLFVIKQEELTVRNIKHASPTVHFLCNIPYI